MRLSLAQISSKKMPSVVLASAQPKYEAIVFTTDANVFGYREWDQRNYRSPGKLSLVHPAGPSMPRAILRVDKLGLGQRLL